MTDDLQRLAEGHHVDRRSFRPTVCPPRPVECRLGPTEGCFRPTEVLLRLKEYHFRPIDDHLGRQIVFETGRFAEGPSDRQLG